jgi:hypothetical protein
MINLNVDTRTAKYGAIKGQQIMPLVKFTEVNRGGIFRWPAVKAQGTLTIATLPTDGETFTIGLKTYTLKTTLTGVDGQIAIGGSLAQCQANIYAALSLTGAPATQYASAMTLNQDITVTGFVGNAIVLTAKVGGTAGNAIATTETMVGAGNIFDGTTLGTTRAGVADTDADSLLVPSYQGSSNRSTSNFVAASELFYAGAGDANGSLDRVFITNPEMMADYPTSTYKILAGATKKFWVSNYFDRRYKHVRLLGVRSYLQRNIIQTIASPFTENSNNRSFLTLAVDTTRLIHFFRQQGGTTGVYALVGTVATNGTITWGAPVLVTALDQYNAEFDAVLVNTDKILCTYGAGASTFTQTCTLSLSGTAITKNADVQVAAVNYTIKRVVKLNTDKALLVANNGGAMVMYVVTITGTVPSYGTVVSTASALVGGYHTAANGTDKAQVVYAANSRMNTAVITVSGTVPTLQASIVVGYETSQGYRSNSLYQIGTDKFVYYHGNGQVGVNRGRTDYKFCYITVASNTSSIANSYEMRSSDYDTNINFMTAIDATNFIFYRFVSGYLMGSKVTVNSATSLTINDRMLRGAGYREATDDSAPLVIRSRGEFENIQQIGEPVVMGTIGTVVVGSDNSGVGNICSFSDKPFSMTLYLNDDVIANFSKTLPLLIEPIVINQAVYLDEFGLKVKNNDAQDLHFYIDHAYITID